MPRDHLQSSIGSERSPHLRARLAVGAEDVGREIEVAVVRHQQRTDAVGINGYVRRLEGTDLLHRETTRGDDSHRSEPGVIEGVPDVAHELGIHAARVELAHCGDHALTSLRVGMVPLAKFQSTPPRGRRRASRTRSPAPVPCFNPRLRAGGDFRVIVPQPSQGRVSIHASAREATPPTTTMSPPGTRFNPRLRAGGDPRPWT